MSDEDLPAEIDDAEANAEAMSAGDLGSQGEEAGDDGGQPKKQRGCGKAAAKGAAEAITNGFPRMLCLRAQMLDDYANVGSRPQCSVARVDNLWPSKYPSVQCDVQAQRFRR